MKWSTANCERLGILLAAFLALGAFGGLVQAENNAPFEAYKQNFFLATYDQVDHPFRKNEEGKFQLSIRKRPWDNVPLYVGYTQVSFWQVFDSQQSAPFRETNYNPEAFIRPAPMIWGDTQLSYQLGLEHESNGQPVGNSRSWNRVYAWPQLRFMERNGLALSFKWWGRIKEKPKVDPTAAEGDDNPDILNYMGDGEWYITMPVGTAHEFFLMMRKGQATPNGTFRLDYTWRPPYFNTRVLLHVQYFTGYGESLIDYNLESKRLSIGFAFSNAAKILLD